MTKSLSAEYPAAALSADMARASGWREDRQVNPQREPKETSRGTADNLRERAYPLDWDMGL